MRMFVIDFILKKENFIIMTTRWIELKKNLEYPSFGFNIKGGNGSPVYVWRVEEGSLAHLSGINSGDQIISANHINFNNIKHHEAIKVLKEGVLLLEVMSTSMMLGSFRGEYYTWIDRHGNPVPPPINNPASMNQQNKRVLNIEINPGQNLGLMIRGGYEYGLGIYVTGVDPDSVAQRAGLQRGDELLEVNGRVFTSITHDKAVSILKSSRKMTIVASYIGKIPADNQLNEKIELIDLDNPTQLVTTATSDLNFIDKDDLVLDFEDNFDLEKTTGMIEEKARTVLTKNEHSRFTFYRLEYQQGFLPVSTFIRFLIELLNTQEKYTLLTEVRELIRPGDLNQFDELIYKQRRGDDDIQHHNTGHAVGPTHHQHSAVVAPPVVPTTGHVPVPVGHESYNDPGQLLISHDPVIAKLQQQATSPSCVRYKVRVVKTKPILGIAIEGGANTLHRLPRVIDVNSEGSASGSNLKAGQVLLTVDGKKLDGLTHEEIARSILDSYVDMTKQHIEFLVVETKSSFQINNVPTTGA